MRSKPMYRFGVHHFKRTANKSNQNHRLGKTKYLGKPNPCPPSFLTFCCPSPISTDLPNCHVPLQHLDMSGSGLQAPRSTWEHPGAPHHPHLHCAELVFSHLEEFWFHQFS